MYSSIYRPILLTSVVVAAFFGCDASSAGGLKRNSPDGAEGIMQSPGEGKRVRRTPKKWMDLAEAAIDQARFADAKSLLDLCGEEKPLTKANQKRFQSLTKKTHKGLAFKAFEHDDMLGLFQNWQSSDAFYMREHPLSLRAYYAGSFFPYLTHYHLHHLLCNARNPVLSHPLPDCDVWRDSEGYGYSEYPEFISGSAPVDRPLMNFLRLFNPFRGKRSGGDYQFADSLPLFKNLLEPPELVQGLHLRTLNLLFRWLHRYRGVTEIPGDVAAQLPTVRVRKWEDLLALSDGHDRVHKEIRTTMFLTSLESGGYRNPEVWNANITAGVFKASPQLVSPFLGLASFLRTDRAGEASRVVLRMAWNEYQKATIDALGINDNPDENSWDKLLQEFKCQDYAMGFQVEEYSVKRRSETDPQADHTQASSSRQHGISSEQEAAAGGATNSTGRTATEEITSRVTSLHQPFLSLLADEEIPHLDRQQILRDAVHRQFHQLFFSPDLPEEALAIYLEDPDFPVELKPLILAHQIIHHIASRDGEPDTVREEVADQVQRLEQMVGPLDVAHSDAKKALFAIKVLISPSQEESTPIIAQLRGAFGERRKNEACIFLARLLLIMGLPNNAINVLQPVEGGKSIKSLKEKFVARANRLSEKAKEDRLSAIGLNPHNSRYFSTSALHDVRSYCGWGGTHYYAWMQEQVKNAGNALQRRYLGLMRTTVGVPGEDPRDGWSYNATAISSGSCNATEEHERSYDEVLNALRQLVENGRMTETQADNARYVVESFRVLHQNNADICRELIERMGISNVSQVFHVRQPRDIILHPEQGDANLEERAINFYNTLMAAWVAVRNTSSQKESDEVMVKFFREAFNPNAPCFEARARQVHSWMETNSHLFVTMSREEEIGTKTVEANICDTAKRLEEEAMRHLPVADEWAKVTEAKATVDADEETRDAVKWAVSQQYQLLSKQVEAEMLAHGVHARLVGQIVERLANKEARDGLITKAQIKDYVCNVLCWPDSEE